MSRPSITRVDPLNTDIEYYYVDVVANSARSTLFDIILRGIGSPTPTYDFVEHISTYTQRWSVWAKATFRLLSVILTLVIRSETMSTPLIIPRRRLTLLASFRLAAFGFREVSKKKKNRVFPSAIMDVCVFDWGHGRIRSNGGVFIREGNGREGSSTPCEISAKFF